ncbi:MAG TPA: glycosyltransferase family 2 protein [Acidimicrobiia bacterium]|nr:glycosyltransferase family 2 protein [Acidimicrobiia bacterium]
MGVQQAATGERERLGDGSVTVVLPCLDEAESVGQCVREAREALASAGLVGEVVVVDNGSSDGSSDIAGEAGARVVHETQRGYGAALRAGFAAARGDVVVMADADFTYDLGRIPDLVAPVVRDEADLVIGGRLDGATRRTMPFLHRFVGTPVLTFLVGRACGGRVVDDSQSGFRAFRRERVAELELRSTGMELASEMLIRAVRAGLRVKEVPAGYRERVGTSKLSTFSDGWRHLQLILALAPDLLLVGPGAAALIVGIGLSVLGFVSPSGVDVGSLHWQPVFFSGITIVLGLQALLAGAVLAYRSSLVRGSVHRRFEFVGRPGFPGACLAGGVVALLLGLGLDAVLFLGWVQGEASPPVRGLEVASLAQSLIIAGATLASFGVVSRYILTDYSAGK